METLPSFEECPLGRPSVFETDRDDFHPEGFFAPPLPSEKRITINLNDDLIFSRGADIPREEAKRTYAELSKLNRELYEHMVELLEPSFLGLAGRINERIVANPEQIRERASQITTYRIPYRFIGLPPNLYDHLNPERPFVPDTKEGIVDLVNSFHIYNERLMSLGYWGDRIRIGKEDFYRDIAYELRRRQLDGSGLFSSEAEKNEWLHYRQLIRDAQRGSRQRPTFHQNVEFVNYLSNRHFSERSGFFEKTDAMFDQCLLADFYGSRSGFNSQIRTPFNNGKQADAEELLRSTHVFMSLIQEDEDLPIEMRKLEQRHGGFLLAHLTRARELEMDYPGRLLRAVRGTLLESTATVSTVFALCECDGIPGFEEDLWGGLEAMLNDDVPVQIATRAGATTAPSTLHGNRFKNVLELSHNRRRINPAVAVKMQEMKDRQTIMTHELWQNYHKALERAKRDPSIVVETPTRFGLHCPFKSNVVRAFAESLILCRAAIHDMAA